ncbi:MAG: MFS transporter [Dehalococcoidia bacterium]
MRPDIRRYLLFGLLGFASLLSVMQFSMIAITLPIIDVDLAAPDGALAWVITIYMLAQAVALPTMGKLNDKFGSRTMFTAGLTVFVLASLAGALSPDIYFLIGARGVQGLAGASLMPATMAIVGDVFASNRARVIGLIGSIAPAGTIIGPNLGGVIVEHLGWRWTLAINVPAGLFIIAAAFFLIRPSAGKQGVRIDLTSVALLSLALSAFIYPLTELSKSSPNFAIIAISAILAVAAGAAFWRRESRAKEPLVDHDLLKRREFRFVFALSFCYGAIIFGATSFVPLYAQEAYGLTTGDSSALLTSRAVTMVIASALAAIMLPRTGYRKPLAVSLLTTGGVLALMSLGLEDPQIAGIQLSNFLYLAILIGLTGVTLGMFGPAANNSGIDIAPDRIAALTGLRSMFLFLGGVISTPLIVLSMSQASTRAQGLELAFLGLALLSWLAILLVWGIPEMVRKDARAGPDQQLPAEDRSLTPEAGEGKERTVRTGGPLA